mmetsp:Transcript_26930/g.79390  ORF Transcript_26930/g.79390 Transcript_26930/m.79390 type:complete len:206 (+) Transcript_26930:400-1017(+)
MVVQLVQCRSRTQCGHDHREHSHFRLHASHQPIDLRAGRLWRVRAHRVGGAHDFRGYCYCGRDCWLGSWHQVPRLEEALEQAGHSGRPGEHSTRRRYEQQRSIFCLGGRCHVVHRYRVPMLYSPLHRVWHCQAVEEYKPGSRRHLHRELLPKHGARNHCGGVPLRARRGATRDACSSLLWRCRNRSHCALCTLLLADELDVLAPQ